MPALSAPRAALVGVSAALASRLPERLDSALEAARRTARHPEIDEVLLQSHLFVGFPIALEALLRWRAIEPASPPPGLDETPEQWAERGSEVCRTVYGRNYTKLRANVQALHPELDRWMVEGGYGRVIGRPGLDLATRELCIVSLLAVWDAPRQLHSHLRGAMNAGATKEQVEAALGIAKLHAHESATRAVELWRRIARSSGPRP